MEEKNRHIVNFYKEIKKSYKSLFFIKIFAIISSSFSKEIFRKGGSLMTSYELIWRLIVLLLLSNYDNKEPKDRID